MSPYCLLAGVPASHHIFEYSGIDLNFVGRLVNAANAILYSVIGDVLTSMVSSQYLCLNARVWLVGGCSPGLPNELTIKVLSKPNLLGLANLPYNTPNHLCNTVSS